MILSRSLSARGNQLNLEIHNKFLKGKRDARGKGMQGEKGCKGKKDAGEKGKRKTKKENENSFT
jgi:hypothetical protein